MRLFATRRAAAILFGLLALGVTALPAAPTHAAPSPDDAAEFIDDLGEQTLRVLRNGSLDRQDKIRRLSDLLSQATDLDRVALLVLGNARRSASQAQINEFQQLFREYAYNAIANQISNYNGQTYEISNTKVVSERAVMVDMRISMAGGRPPVTINFRVRQQDDGDYSIIDVFAENISLVITQRNDFNAAINRQGFDGMLTQLRERVNAGLGASSQVIQ